MLSPDPLRPPFEFGLTEARRGPGGWLVLGALIFASAVSFSVAVVMLRVPLVSGPMIEAPVPDGPWIFEWGANAVPPSVEQQGQVRALRTVAGGAAALVSILCFLTIAGLWRQRLLLRQHEYFVQWALGARKLQIAARLIGEARVWVGTAMGVAAGGTAIAAVLIDRSFPGAAPLAPNLGASSIQLTGLAVVLVRWEARAGARSHEAGGSGLGELVGSPAMIGAVGFAALMGVGLLTVHAPGGRITTSSNTGTVAAASLEQVPKDRRGDVISEWTARARAGNAPVGFASAGMTRGTGRRDFATVECGRCFEGGMPMPLRIVSPEVFAVAPDTFVHLGMTVSSGRDFDDAVDRGAPSAVIVSGALAARHFEDGDPLGRRLRVGESDWLTVVGVVDGSDGYAVFLPLAQARPADIELLASGAASSLRPALDGAPPGVVVRGPRTMAEVFSAHHWFRRWLSAMGAAASALLGAGLWVSAANEAAATGPEIAVRRAVGATRRSFWTFYVVFAGRRLAFALVVGAWLSLFLGAGLELASPSIPRSDWRIGCGIAAWVAAAYVLGSLRPMLRTASAPLLRGLEGSA
jgi:hypothetical protein